METNCKILIVDDNPTNVRILEELLEDFIWKSVYSGEEALKVAPIFRPDIVLLDIMMPVSMATKFAKKYDRIRPSGLPKS